MRDRFIRAVLLVLLALVIVVLARPYRRSDPHRRRRRDRHRPHVVTRIEQSAITRHRPRKHALA